MAIIGLSLDNTRKYQSKFDPERGKPEATTFLLGTLDSRIMGRLRDLATTIAIDPARPNDEVETTVNQSEVEFQTVMYGLRGVECFRDEKGNDIPFKTEKRNHGGKSYVVASPSVVERLPRVVISELAGEIMAENELTEDAAKN